MIEIAQKQAHVVDVPLSIAVETSLGRERREVLLLERHQTVSVPVGQVQLRSIRVDDRAALPVGIAHERPIDMLLFQVAHEPDVVGRVEAVEALKAICLPPDDRGRCLKVVPTLAEDECHEPSRLVRRSLHDLAETISAKTLVHQDGGGGS